MSIEGQGHFFTIYFPGFVCFVLYLAKISGERLQDHWSSGWYLCEKRAFSWRLKYCKRIEILHFIEIKQNECLRKQKTINARTINARDVHLWNH